jgi:hypothetical protein
MVVMSNKAVTAQAAAVRMPDKSGGTCKMGKNATNSDLCRASYQSVVGQGSVWTGAVWRLALKMDVTGSDSQVQCGRGIQRRDDQNEV